MMVIQSPSPFGRYAPPTGGPPVLVIDDDAIGAASTSAMLTDAGYPALSESDGDTVLRLVRTQVMRMVVSEIHVPCADGPCVVAALKQDRVRLPRLRVLVYTRHTSAADTEWALAAGCDALVHRGSSPEVFLREVRRIDGDQIGARDP